MRTGMTLLRPPSLPCRQPTDSLIAWWHRNLLSRVIGALTLIPCSGNVLRWAILCLSWCRMCKFTVWIRLCKITGCLKYSFYITWWTCAMLHKLLVKESFLYLYIWTFQTGVFKSSLTSWDKIKPLGSIELLFIFYAVAWRSLWFISEWVNDVKQLRCSGKGGEILDDYVLAFQPASLLWAIAWETFQCEEMCWWNFPGMENALECLKNSFTQGKMCWK